MGLAWGAISPYLSVVLWQQSAGQLDMAGVKVDGYRKLLICKYYLIPYKA